MCLIFVRNLIKNWKQTLNRQKCFIFVAALSLLIIFSSGVAIRGRKLNPIASAAYLQRSSAGTVLEKCSIQKSDAKLLKPISRGMPKIFHQTYKTSSLPNTYHPYIVKCRNLNPDWEYYLWRDEDIEEFMTHHFPSYIRKYRTFSMNVQRADFIRYMVLYHYGGIYLDMDVECVKPFFPSLENESAFLDQERREHAQILYNQEYMAMNSAMGSVAGHPFYLSMLEAIVALDDKVQGAGPTTGPDRLTAVYREWAASDCMKIYPVTLLEPVVFSPIADVKLHNFHSECSAGASEKSHWKGIGCQLMTNKNWEVDFSDNRTVGKHLFLHLGYDWGPKSRTFFEVNSLGPVKMYKQDGMQR